MRYVVSVAFGSLQPKGSYLTLLTMPAVPFSARRFARVPALAVFVALLGLLAAALPASAQPRLRWGSVPDEHKNATAGTDSNAVAIVLADVGRVSFTDDGKQVFEHHRRVKLLSPNAFEDWGTVDIVYDNATDRLRDLRAQTHVPTPDGGYRRVEVGRRDFFNETLGAKVKRSRFTFPALEPGAIVEYSYTIQSDYIYRIPSWTFQNEEPTLWSEFRVDLISQLAFAYSINGLLPDDFVVNSSEQGRSWAGPTNILRWGVRDRPALRDEPLATSRSDFEARIDFQLASVNLPGFGSVAVWDSWSKIVDDLIGREGSYRSALGNVTDRARAIVSSAQATTPTEKVEALYQFVTTSIQPESTSGLLSGRSATDVLRDRKGSSAEVNLLLVALLRDAGLDASPALVSTRDHGRIRRGYPLIGQFNRVVAFVRDGQQTWTLDATEPLRPSSLLPERYTNNLMWVVKAPEGEWVQMRATPRRSVLGLTATLGDDLGLRGTVEYSSTGHGALHDRIGLRDADDETAYVRDEILEAPADVVLDSITVHEKAVPASPLRITASFARTGAAQDIGGRLYLQPVFFDQETESPLVSPTRRLPVDIGSPVDATYTLRLTLPEDLELAERPGPKRVTLAAGGTLTQGVTQTGRLLTYTLRFQLTQPVYDPAGYGALRAFFDALVATQAEPIVLQRRATTGAGN